MLHFCDLKILRVPVWAIAFSTSFVVTRVVAIDAPVSPNALPEVHALLGYMDSIHGTNILAGQQEFPDWPWNPADEDELEYIQRISGKTPAVRGFDLMFYTHSEGGRSAMEVSERAIAWAQQGGIVTICLHWFMDVNSPNGPAFYTPGAHATQFTNFDIRQAVLDGTPENAEFMAELDIVAEELKKLRDARVPVIWRPFHEQGGTWFWWSRYGAAPFKTAWQMMFDRFTQVHGLTNLLWEFNPNDATILADWYPGHDYVDLISLDVYPGSGHPVYAAEYNQYWNFTGGRKLVALSENGRMPDPDQLTAQNAHWVYFCTWDGQFITSDTYNDLAFKQAIFNHARVITLDELPKVYLWGRAPQFITQPESHAVAVGANVTLTAAADANETFSYQWYYNGAAIAGETGASLALTDLQADDAGSYTVRATSTLGATSSHASAIVVGPPTGRLRNVSTRAQVRTGDGVLIAGFVVGGTSPRSLLVRGVGPGLTAYGLSPTEVLSQPEVALYEAGGATPIFLNGDWQQFPSPWMDIEAARIAVGAFPPGAFDGALLVTLDPGGYTVHVRKEQLAVGDPIGIALAEVYDVSGDNATSRILNLSTRGYVSTGSAVMIPGLVVGEAGRRLLVRGVGPGLASTGLTGLLPNPVVRVVDVAGNEIAANDNWGSAAASPEIVAATTDTGAFVLPDDSLDSALIVTLPPGNFTVLVNDNDGQSGIAIVEAYEMAP